MDFPLPDHLIKDLARDVDRAKTFHNFFLLIRMSFSVDLGPLTRRFGKDPNDQEFWGRMKCMQDALATFNNPVESAMPKSMRREWAEQGGKHPTLDQVRLQPPVVRPL